MAFPPRRDGIAVEDRADEGVRMLVAEPVPPQRELDEGLLQRVLGQVCVTADEIGRPEQPVLAGPDVR